MSASKKYIAVVGLNYTPVGGSKEIRVEAGEEPKRMTRATTRTYLADGHIIEQEAGE